MSTYTYEYMHTHVQTINIMHSNTCTHKQRFTDKHAHINWNTYTHLWPHMVRCTNTYTNIYILLSTLIYFPTKQMHLVTYTYILMHTPNHKHIPTHKCIPNHIHNDSNTNILKQMQLLKHKYLPKYTDYYIHIHIKKYPHI